MSKCWVSVGGCTVQLCGVRCEVWQYQWPVFSGATVSLSQSSLITLQSQLTRRHQQIFTARAPPLTRREVSLVSLDDDDVLLFWWLGWLNTNFINSSDRFQSSIKMTWSVSTNDMYLYYYCTTKTAQPRCVILSPAVPDTNMCQVRDLIWCWAVSLWSLSAASMAVPQTCSQWSWWRWNGHTGVASWWPSGSGGTLGAGEAVRGQRRSVTPQWHLYMQDRKWWRLCKSPCWTYGDQFSNITIQYNNFQKCVYFMNNFTFYLMRQMRHCMFASELLKS